MSQITHTFAVLAYGESPFLSACIDSLLMQREQSRILLCTSTPNDSIASIAKRYSLPLCVNPAHNSIAGDWNYAASCVETPYYTLAHQDDLYYPDYTASLLPEMDGSLIGFTDYEELVGGAPRRHTPMLGIKRMLLAPFLFTSRLRSASAKRSVLRFGSAVCCPSVMYNRALLKDFAFDPAFRVSLDWEAWLRLTERDGAFLYASKVLMAHRIHADSETTRQIASDGRAREDALLMDRLWPKPVSSLLSKAYAHSTDSNRVGGKK